MILQPIVDIAEICALKGITDVIASPGSRCAPITLAFARHPSMHVRSISDERSAAFTALGMAQSQKEVIVLVCTSGSASYNYAPGVAEAFYQQIPLLILTADRPPEWIDQYDGQTIHQSGIYGKHVKKSYDLPVEYEHEDAKWHINRIINEAINLASSTPKGPVHVNVPIRAPFYPDQEEVFNYNKDVRIIYKHTVTNNIDHDLALKVENSLKSFSKILVVAGQIDKDEALINALNAFNEKFNCPVIADVISNVHACHNAIRHQDAFLSAINNQVVEALKPELLITFGKSVISKQVKIFLRGNKAIQHWHIRSDEREADTFQSLTDIYSMDPVVFFKTLERMKANNDKQYFQLWKNLDNNFKEFSKGFFSKQLLNEFNAVYEVMHHLPDDTDLHLANSMAVRYANFIGMFNNSIEVFANRGTSGIDGAVSTAVGAALKSKRLVVLLVGDMAFFYDRNAFWQKDLPNNLRIIVMNNHAGGIFGLIEGPNRLPELSTYFETEQPLDAQYLAQENNINYQKVTEIEELKRWLPECLSENSGLNILEIETDKTKNKEFYTTFKQEMCNIYGNINVEANN